MNPKIQGLIFDEDKQQFKIRELEVSITSKCHLQCNNCGFCIPSQPSPSLSGNVIEELSASLSHLKRLNINIGSLGLLGGEPSFNKSNLELALKAFSKFDNINRIEIVSHGLTPQNITKESLKLIDKISLSIYFDNKKLITLWEEYLLKFASHIELSLRIEKVWDRWFGEEVVDDEKAQELFDSCWYRKHCVTLERQRIFMCSRIPKLSQDKEGLILDSTTSFDDILNYLNKTEFTNSCKSCIPMMGLSTVKAGVQPDNRIHKMIPKAIQFLTSELNEKS
ncbi:hypothetical protein [Aureispira sp. CCB-E]|uniref:hypothetical protein n=1 Tax=Aureispira sp. CCB-E TaxID=3051121 RepID=UPI0028692782|nr:hypothetical protein [Aureispira sp. CCB-E]WMX17169.1 hypothetical protein QP953_12365 [Aureispira sp. CCB-E]